MITYFSHDHDVEMNIRPFFLRDLESNWKDIVDGIGILSLIALVLLCLFRFYELLFSKNEVSRITVSI